MQDPRNALHIGVGHGMLKKRGCGYLKTDKGICLGNWIMCVILHINSLWIKKIKDIFLSYVAVFKA